MTGNPFDSLAPAAPAGAEEGDPARQFQCSYDDLCRLKVLELAYDWLREHFPDLVDAHAENAPEGKAAAKFLRQLSADLTARTYQPGAESDSAGLRDLVIQAALG